MAKKKAAETPTKNTFEEYKNLKADAIENGKKINNMKLKKTAKATEKNKITQSQALTQDKDHVQKSKKSISKGEKNVAKKDTKQEKVETKESKTIETKTKVKTGKPKSYKDLKSEKSLEKLTKEKRTVKKLDTFIDETITENQAQKMAKERKKQANEELKKIKIVDEQKATRKSRTTKGDNQGERGIKKTTKKVPQKEEKKQETINDMVKTELKVKDKSLSSTAGKNIIAETAESIKSYPAITDKRLTQIRFVMLDEKMDGIAVTYLPNIRYLTNFSGSAGTLFIFEDSIHFVTDDRYEEQIKTELYPLPNLKTHISRNPWQYAMDSGLLKNISTLGFEADRVPYSEVVEIRNIIRPVKFKPEPKIVERFTQPKSPEELANIQKACDLSIQVYEKILEIIKPGMTEKDIASEIAYISRKLGSEGDAFDIIVVSGPRSAMVHGKPSHRKIKKNDVITLDFGCIVNGFRSDITRTFVIGKATKEQKDIYKLLVNAKNAAIESVTPAMNGKHLDKIARQMIEKAGYGKFFQHSLGHGIGIEVHEMPIITFRKEDQIIPEDVVLAIEPGVYFPDKFGMRVEDDIFVTRYGAKVLTKAPEDLLVL